MIKKSFSPLWLRTVLQLAIWQIALLVLAWLLFWQVGWLRGYKFSDSLFMVGLLQCVIGGAVLMSSPVDETGGVWQRMWARSGELPDTRGQLLADFAQKETFFTRLVISGVATMLISVIASFLG